MFLIPFIHRTNLNVHYIYVFLNQGKMFIQEDNIEEFLEINCMFPKKIVSDNEYSYIEIDTEKTDIKSFYTYNESAAFECWRRFTIFEDDALHTNETVPEFIKNVLKKILELK
jgi:hypothetical protein